MKRNRNGLCYYEIIKRMEYLNKKDIELELEFIKIFDKLTTLYKDYPF
jgi:hypothetical protein